MKKKIKEMDNKRKLDERGGRRGIGGGRPYESISSVVTVTAPVEQPKYNMNANTNSSNRITAGKKGMQLGSKRGNVDSFVDQLKNEGEGLALFWSFFKLCSSLKSI